MPSLATVAPVIGAGVDWLSMSCNRPAGMRRLLDWSHEEFGNLLAEGWQAQRLSTHGRTGWAVGGVSVVSGSSDVLVQLSSERARVHWRDVAIEATGASRVDLQVTTRPNPSADSLVELGYRALERFSPSRGRRPVATLLTTTEGGKTLYVGRKTSDRWARLYDKGSESGEVQYQGCWRYEVVEKRRYAYAALQALLASKNEGPLVASRVHDWFNRRGVRPCFDANTASDGTPAPRERSDNQRWREWYQRSVRPSVTRRFPDLEWRQLVQLLVPRAPTRADLEAWLATLSDDDDVTGLG